MHELTDYSESAISRWLDESERAAEGLRRLPESDPRHRLAISILGAASHLRGAVRVYQQPEQQRRELLMSAVNEWKAAHPGQNEPPQSVWHSLNAEAAKRAFREQYPRLAEHVDAISDMRAQAEALGR